MDFDSILNKVKRLPPNPQVMMKLMKLLQSMDAGSFEIVSLVKVDAALAAQILRMANSAFYAAEPTHDLEDAINRIGFRETYKLVGAICSNQIFSTLPKPTHPGADLLWEHSIGIALLMEFLAPRLGLDPTSTYTTGLLHSIGKFVINQAVGDQYPMIYAIIENEKASLPDAEMRVLGFTHADVGVALLKKWNFPTTIIEAVQNQFTPFKASESMAAACTLHVSICMIQGTIPIPGHLTRDGQIYKDALLKLSLSAEDMDSAYTRILPRLEDIKTLLAAATP